MARKYDMTRFALVTVATVKTVDDDFNVVEKTFILDGMVSEDECQKQASKKYGKAKVTDLVFSGTMYGLTTEEVMRYGHPLNPFTRQPWADNDDKEALTKQYILEKVLKVDSEGERG